MSFEDLTFSWHISIGFSNASRKGTVNVSDYFSESEWDEMSEKDRDDWLGEFLEDEISNTLDANIWIDE